MHSTPFTRPGSITQNSFALRSSKTAHLLSLACSTFLCVRHFGFASAVHHVHLFRTKAFGHPGCVHHQHCHHQAQQHFRMVNRCAGILSNAFIRLMRVRYSLAAKTPEKVFAFNAHKMGSPAPLHGHQPSVVNRVGEFLRVRPTTKFVLFPRPWRRGFQFLYL